MVRDRDYLLDRHGVIFKVIGDVHPDSHYLGYVKYHPDSKGDRRLFGQTYRQNSVVSKSFGILANRPVLCLLGGARLRHHGSSTPGDRRSLLMQAGVGSHP